jgi:hypothetical protein
VEVADLFLERQGTPTGLPDLSQVERQWIDSRPVDARESPPVEVARAAMSRALDSIRAWHDAQPEGHLPDSFPLGDGLSVREMTLVLAGLMGMASLSEHTARRLKRLETTLMHAPRGWLLGLLAELCPGVDQQRIGLVLQRLTFRVGRSTRTAPLVEHGDRIIVCPPLLTPRAVDVIMLRTAASDPHGFRSVGQQLGDRAGAWAECLSRISGVVVAERVPVRGQDGRSVGDLDIVAVDPARRVGISLEIKWSIDALTWREGSKVERRVASAARQLAGLRQALTSGVAVAEMPAEWPSFDEVEWTWCAGTPQQLSLRPLPVPGVHATSLRYLTSRGEPPDLASVIDILRKPDLPRAGLHFRQGRVSFRVGRQTVSMDTIEITTPTWRPRLRRAT